jgi:hypothetical protein
MEIPENLLEFADRCVTTKLSLCSNIDPEAGAGLNFVFSNFEER